MNKRGKILVISGPSGSGKTTLRDKLLEYASLKRKFTKSVSFTTRPKRSRERHGRDYFFLKDADFKRRLKAKEILEWTKYLGYYYGTSRGFVSKQLEQGKCIILCLDLKGALRVKRLFPRNSVTIFVLPPSLRTLRQRIEKRCQKTKKEEIARRLRLAKEELNTSRHYDYTIVNKNLERAVRELRRIVLEEMH
ncbi:MAG: guanylate kinase [Candidatus Omnitrophica bacterium]|nr:guanylate kinase [Candidatus Omnitrophota bacterium]